MLDNNEKLGSWKCLVVRPDWKFLRRIEAIFSRSQERNMRKLMSLCTDVNALGVIFKNSMREKDKSVHQRRVAFRNVSASTARENQKSILGAFAQKELSDHLAKQLSELGQIYNEAAPPSLHPTREQKEIDRMVGQIMDSINKALASNWHLIEPSQIVSELQILELGDGADIQIHQYVMNLLSLDNVEPFGK